MNHLARQPSYLGQISHIEHIAPQSASSGEMDTPLPPPLEKALGNKGFLPLYRHQATAINRARCGQNVMVATPSASGKTICYNVPVLEQILRDPEARALYLYPTKALAQDQLRGLKELACPNLIAAEKVAIFDGDTPYRERAEIRKQARVILSNPDMLHVGILPNHKLWSQLLHHLKYVVLDEAHAYRGVFGSHVALIMRRLRRLCALYGTSPQYILCSATIANPGEHAGKLTGLPFAVVANDGSPHGKKDFVFWNPPLSDRAKGTRRSTNSEAASLFTELVGSHLRTLTFTRTRRLTELIYTYARQKLAEIDPPLAARIKPYRAGYLPELRREIEQGLFSGALLGVVTTNALEMGINIGDLEATVLTGYPGSIASTWQQAGRSGRGKDTSLSFLVAQDNPLDQYLMHHPEFFFEMECENALVNPDNPYILRAHLLCAAWEIALSESDDRFFDMFHREIPKMEQEGLLKKRRRRWYLSPDIGHPARDVGIRDISGEDFSLIETKTDSLLETVPANVAFFQVYPGAVYLHQGEPYLVTRLDLAGKTAYAEPASVPYYTETKEITDLRITGILQRKEIRGIKIFLGEVAVTTTITGFKKKMPLTSEVIGEEPLDLPPYKFATVALWFDFPEDSAQLLNDAGLDFAGGLHGTEHAAIAMLPLFALCDRNDIGGVSTPYHPDTGKAQVFIYDAYPGGIGIAEKGFELIEALWRATLGIVSECTCADGCPGCIQSPKCGNNNQPLDKQAVIVLLRGLTGIPRSTPGSGG
ncbi:MAG: DEAD/DEAH box helicase [Chloroflexota bacterium]